MQQETLWMNPLMEKGHPDIGRDKVLNGIFGEMRGRIQDPALKELAARIHPRGKLSAQLNNPLNDEPPDKHAHWRNCLCPDILRIKGGKLSPQLRPPKNPTQV